MSPWNKICNIFFCQILLHHPAEIPRVGSQFFRAPLNQEIVVSVKPDMMTTSPGLKTYDPHRRQCFFPSERYLSFFQSYTQQNCQVECLTNYTLAKCGCVAYHMPRKWPVLNKNLKSLKLDKVTKMKFNYKKVLI